ncbi:hypothetical protein [Acetobacter syzygii]|uniref:hypothetical protein n=1 Tax=Acetobacter syzygii TaxID=146476 RepID=UPI0039E999EA
MKRGFHQGKRIHDRRNAGHGTAGDRRTKEKVLLFLKKEEKRPSLVLGSRMPLHKILK